MTPTPRPEGARDFWPAYAPSEEAPWNLQRVVHLHRRAAFAATWDEVQRDLKEGPKASIDRILSGSSRSQGVPEAFEPTAKLLADSAIHSKDPDRLKAWWIYRMIGSPDPLGERLTLLWHDHFATSNLKVDDLGTMHRQNELFRRFARAPFGELLNAAVHDPALLNWLDAPTNRRGHPNENLGRELMELFTLGIGHYTETDVKEAARALTGWTINDNAFFEDPAAHDDGEKSLFGRTGRWKGADLVSFLLDNPATAQRLASRVCGLLMGEGVVETNALTALADDLRRNDLDIGRAVEKVLRSHAFFDSSNLGTRVLGPVEFALGPIRALEMFEPAPSTLVLADWIARLGQDLFYPPNVGGWPGGRSWLTTRAVIGRANFAAALVQGQPIGRPGPFDGLKLFERHGRGRNTEEILTFACELLNGCRATGPRRHQLMEQLESRSSGPSDMARRAVALIVAAPESQLA